jgi:hypothetical protein
MTSRSKLLLLGAFGLGLMSTTGSQSQAQTPIFEYAAKYVCGRAGGPTGPVAPGQYYTAINVHNPNDSFGFKKKFVVAPPGEKEGGFISKWYDTGLKFDAAYEIDCPDILDKVHPPNTPQPNFAKGFVIIQSPHDLDIVAVYTAAASASSPVVSMSVERVPKR